MKAVTREEHLARVKALRAAGYKVKTIKLPDGSLLVLRSKKAFVCSAHHHCTERRRAHVPEWPHKRR